MIHTKILDATNQQDIIQAIDLIKQGELVAIPTETVYGLGADAKNPHAVYKIFKAKERPADHPLILHIGSLQALSYWVEDLSADAEKLMNHFWPGPLTLVLKKSDHVHDVITGGLSTVAIRMPHHPILLHMLQQLDTALAAPSANLHKKISPTQVQHVLSGLDGKIAAVLNAGPCSVGIESTIIDMTQSVPTILRHGPVTQAMIEELLQTSIHVPEKHEEKIAGNMKVHYQPHTKSVLISLQEIKQLLLASEYADQKIAVMHYSDFIHNNPQVVTVQLSSNKSEYTQYMYQTLHDLDKVGAAIIAIEQPPFLDEWKDVIDRLTKATA